MYFVIYKYVDVGDNFGCMKCVMFSDNNFLDIVCDICKIKNVYMIFMYILSDYNKIIKIMWVKFFLLMNIVLFLNIYLCIYLFFSLNVKCVWGLNG